jgi:hypothetical protein
MSKYPAYMGIMTSAWRDTINTYPLKYFQYLLFTNTVICKLDESDGAQRLHELGSEMLLRNLVALGKSGKIHRLDGPPCGRCQTSHVDTMANDSRGLGLMKNQGSMTRAERLVYSGHDMR